MFKPNKKISHISKNSIMKFNQQETLNLNDFNIIINKCLKLFNESSETTRTISFYQWLAGLIEADGCFCISKKNYVSCEITVNSRKIKSLYKIKKYFFGRISHRKNTNSFRWRLHKKQHVKHLLNSVNGYVYLKVDKFKEVLNLFDLKFKQHEFSFYNAWLSGFFEGGGYANINKTNYQITLSILQKNTFIFLLIKKYFGGNIFYDKSWNGYSWYVTSKKDLLLIFKYFTLYPLKSDKNSDIISVKRFFRYKIMNYHLNSLKFKQLNHFIDLFQKRKKI
jgi:ubiquinol-cytochrome c reductase cytochrome b subunit